MSVSRREKKFFDFVASMSANVFKHFKELEEKVDALEKRVAELEAKDKQPC